MLLKTVTGSVDLSAKELEDVLAILDKAHYIVEVKKIKGGCVVYTPAYTHDAMDIPRLESTYIYSKEGITNVVKAPEFEGEAKTTLLPCPLYAQRLTTYATLVSDCDLIGYPPPLVRFILAKKFVHAEQFFTESDEPGITDDEEISEKEALLNHILGKALMGGFCKELDEEAVSMDIEEGFQIIKNIFMQNILTRTFSDEQTSS